MLYRGYVPTSGKKCTMRFKGKDDLLTLEQAQRLKEYAGVLADGIVLVDFDDAGMAETALRMASETGLGCVAYRTTRGVHLLMRAGGHYDSCGTAVRLACGMEADIKLGSKNSYEVLRIDGHDREVVIDRELEDAPPWLWPCRSERLLYGMDEGDGRNGALFSHILNLGRAGLSKEQSKEVLRLANAFVLESPLEEKELEKVMRDDAFVEAESTRFFSGRTFLHADFGDWLTESRHIVRIDGLLHVYKDGVYEDGYKVIEEAMVEAIRTLTAQRRTEVIKYLEITAPVIQRSDARYIAFEDMLYDVGERRFREFSPAIAVTNRIPHLAPVETEAGFVDEVLDRMACGDHDTRALLEEMAGYCLYRRSELRKAFVLLGDKANGKSTYLDMVKTLLGEKNVSALDLKEIGDRFKTAELYGKLANIGDDIGDDFIRDMAIFKKAVSGDRMNAERKGQDPFDFSPYAKLLFSANAMPRVKDRTGAVLDRLVIVPFKATFAKGGEGYDPYIKYRLREEANVRRFAWLALQGLSRVLEREAFTIPESSAREMTEYESRNDSVQAFLSEDEEVENRSTKDVYRRYSEFCMREGIQPVSNIELTRQIKRRTGLEPVQKMIKGERAKIYRK